MKKNGGWIGKKKPILKINSNNNKKWEPNLIDKKDWRRMN